jgi:hypothetical protein
MRLSWKGLSAIGLVLLAAPAACLGASCTTQAELNSLDRDALADAGARISTAVVQQNFSALQAALLPSEEGNWENIRGAVEDGAPLVKGGQAQIRNLYLLDNTGQSAPADTQFFCSNASGSMTVTITMRALPPGRYAVVLADAAGAPLSGQMAFILAWDGSGASGGWKLGGVSLRQGTFGGHDGVWYWTRARELAKLNLPWNSWYCYDAARYLLVPMDFLSSPNLEKLEAEQTQLKNSPLTAFPYSIPDGSRTWKIDSVRLDPSLREADLGVTYESTGVTDPAALRTEAVAVLSALLKAHPGLRQNFHGLWAYAVKEGKRTPVIELPMGQIP